MQDRFRGGGRVERITPVRGHDPTKRHPTEEPENRQPAHNLTSIVRAVAAAADARHQSDFWVQEFPLRQVVLIDNLCQICNTL
jgi:hypothetical protein